ncbi:electron transfer flavoprotein-ubiquinone oxidoreductase [Polycladidibacter stylochi]|uniref:electron transfer flavoprotein-ubiquinone oxidoreductase n=1 Tax=Polycladidibacter stylochi TaxID=1807766 RepID=UPI00082D1A38|nr:electron transfer flavoprotein-ubiquinone oxidoreductase [Pseudovibrio stylochi]
MADVGTLPPRESMEFDVVIVGAGPAGLAAAIRLKQLATEQEKDISVVVLEKGSEVGAHILSGAVMDTCALDELLPDWRKDDTVPLNVKVNKDTFLLLSEKKAISIPNFTMPRLMNNHGNYIISLGNVCRWLAEKAEAMGVEIYPGFAAAEVLYDEDGKVRGVATGDMGVAKDGSQKDTYMRGMELVGKYTLIGEGVRGSLAKQLIEQFNLDRDSDTPKFGIGIKELWEVEPEKHQQGLVQHTLGWPLDSKTGGGSFLYHLDNNQVAVGFVVHLNYENPYLSPFEEFQRFKHHPAIENLFKGGKRIAYGARAIAEGGFQSIPKLAFPGGLLMGCSAGLVNLPRIKGSHNAIYSGKLAAEKVMEALVAEKAGEQLDSYDHDLRAGAIGKDLKLVRNVKPLLSRFGNYLGMMMGGFDMWLQELVGVSLFGTLHHRKTDAASLKPAADVKPINYPKPDGKISFDRLSSVFLSNTNHEEDQPIHLKLRDEALQKLSELDKFAGPSARYCPAGVYEWVEENGENRFQINAQNCVHCKTCDIKDPNSNITWTVPEGQGGPNYPNM